MCSAASKMVPNRLLFGDSFDRVGSEAFSLQNNQSSSLERGWEGDCGRATRMDAYDQKVVSLRSQLFVRPSLVPATASQARKATEEPANIPKMAWNRTKRPVIMGVSEHDTRLCRADLENMFQEY